ncbi:hypothetical protein INT43_007504 [Umbelopsis isabellina]|uniref:Uncharacterized protein n=1 Tax=Mortierella isabellina TaxID=91625 RepID=A0A8H7UJZ9_MORIS|nr:hypothetical protein INT43_007504 [Umbelopsis isabellina]
MKFTILTGLFATVFFGGLASGAPIPNAELLAAGAAAPPTAVQPIMKLTPEQSNLLKNAKPEDMVAQPGNVQRIHKVGSTTVGHSDQQSYTNQQGV